MKTIEAPETIGHARVQLAIDQIATTADSFPSLVSVYEACDLKPLYFSRTLMDSLNAPETVLANLSYDRYRDTFLQTELGDELKDAAQVFITQNTDEPISFFQQIRAYGTQNFDWYHSTMKVLLRGDDKTPLLLLVVASKVDSTNQLSVKAIKTLQEELQIRKSYQHLPRLTSREQEILRLVVTGKTASDIGNTLHIASSTAQTHRKNIYQKLKLNNTFQLSQYARAFNLI